MNTFWTTRAAVAIVSTLIGTWGPERRYFTDDQQPMAGTIVGGLPEQKL